MAQPVYLVDDDTAVRKALSLLLSTIDIEVRSFADPSAFLAQLPRLTPGCLIFDIRMPVMTGLKLQELLEAQAIDWPVIIISGHGDIEACRRAFRNGAVDYLSKPVDEQDLIDAIQKAQQ
jgi:FixJ family two-component response regulator